MKAVLTLLLLLLTACTAVPVGLPITGDAYDRNLSTPGINAAGVRMCAYMPGVSVPNLVFPESIGLSPTSNAFTNAESNQIVDEETTARQLEIYQQVWQTVQDNFVYDTAQGLEWQEFHQKNQSLIRAGMDAETFYQTMQKIILKLDGGQSQFLSPNPGTFGQNLRVSTSSFVGIGSFYTWFDQPEPALVITSVFPGSPAELAGLKSHDIIRKVDGGPVFDSQGSPATLGPEGSSITLTVETPGQPSREVALTRSIVEAPVQIDTCLVPGTLIGYIHLLGYEEPEVVNQIADALEQMSAEGLLQGLIIDTRVNQGGQIDTLKQLLSLFTQGELGSFVSRSQVQSFAIYSPLDISGSQTVPLVVLQDQTSGPQAQMLAGVLQLQGRAQIIGEPVAEPLYLITPYYFPDGSELLLASATFQPVGKTNRYFDLEGVVPDVVIPSRWDLFTEATDPLLAKAVELLK